MNDNTKTLQLRNTLLDNGYRPIPIKGKRTLIKGWTHDTIDVAWTAKHCKRHPRGQTIPYPHTGIRCDDLVAFDIDVLDENLADECESIVLDMCGGEPLCRIGRFPKRLLLYRLDDTGLRPLRTGKYGGHRVEIMSTPGQQFAAFSIHPGTKEPYVWLDADGEPGASPLDTPRADLSPVDVQTVTDCVAALEVHLEATGLEKQAHGHSIESSAAVVYDLQDSTPILVDSTPTTWAEVKTMLPVFGNLMRENGAFGDSNGVHFMTSDVTGEPCAHDFARDVTHHEAVVSEDLADVLPEQPDASPGMFCEDGMTRLLNNYVLLADKTVRNVYHPEDTISYDGFKNQNGHWTVPAPTPTQPHKTVEAVTAWRQHPRTKRADKAVLRPDLPDEVLIEEEHRTLMNTYNPPKHVTGGEIDTVMEFIEHLVPKASDREIFLDWHALKMANPHWRMHGLLMVTEIFGTGRGTWSNIVQALFGRAYVSDVPFSRLVGQGGQSEYTEYLANSLIVTAQEALDERDDRSKWQSRRIAYETLKLICDSSASHMYISRKYGKNSTEAIYASILISTNHADALVIPGTDRRLIVLGNSDLPLVDAPNNLSDRIHAWKDVPANIGTLAAYLKDRAAGAKYDPFGHPPMTSAKRFMIALSQSGIDELYAMFVEDAKGDVAVFYQWKSWATAHINHVDSQLPEGSNFEAALNSIWKVKVAAFEDVHWEKMKISGLSLLPRIIRNKSKWKSCVKNAEIRNEVLKNGSVAAEIMKMPSRK